MSGQEWEPGDEHDDETLAAEYALGVLDGSARRGVERRMRREPGLAFMVAEWQTRLSPLIEPIAPVVPAEGLWSGIAGDLERIARVAPAPAPVKSAAAARGVGRRVSGYWQWLGLASTGLAVASLAALLILAQPHPAPMMAEIAGDDGPVLYTAFIDRSSARAMLMPVSLTAAAPGHSHELWLIAPGSAPKSLGVLASTGAIRIEIARELLENGKVLAISLEPAGGSPTGQPTGPVVAKGELKSI